MQYLIRSPRTELPRNPRKIPEYFEKQIFLLELGFIYGAPIWLNNAVCATYRIIILLCLKPQFHSPHLHQTTNMSEWLNRAVRTALLSHLLYSFHPMTPSWHAINPVTNNVAAQEFREYQRHPSGSSSQPFRRTYPR